MLKEAQKCLLGQHATGTRQQRTTEGADRFTRTAKCVLIDLPRPLKGPWYSLRSLVALSQERNDGVSMIATNPRQAIFKCPESVPAGAATCHAALVTRFSNVSRPSQLNGPARAATSRADMPMTTRSTRQLICQCPELLQERAEISLASVIAPNL
eukprot:1655943-Pleurochrysis_carterae.AAC.3